MTKKNGEKKNPFTEATVCSICDFPIDPESENGWFDHVAKAERFFLRNIYSKEEMKKVEISNIEDYKEILFRLLNIHHHFQVALQDGAYNDEIRDFMVDNSADLRIDIEKVIIPKKLFVHKSELFSEKIIAFCIQIWLNFVEIQR